MENPSAFPVSTPGFTYGDGSTEMPNTEYGMTLRDYFAAKAMQGILASYANPATTSIPADEQAAAWAYGYADAMLAARTVQPIKA